MGHSDSTGGGVDNKTWLIDAGHVVIEKRRMEGEEALGPRGRLLYAFWVADYSMRNSGDLRTARDLDARYRETAREAAIALSLPVAIEAFSLSEGELERRYFDLFDPLCAELRGR